MNDNQYIPLLTDLISKGQVIQDPLPAQPQPEENLEIEIEVEEENEDTSIRELIIDEEIRMILDKHMDNAYEEIIHLLKNKIA